MSSTSPRVQVFLNPKSGSTSGVEGQIRSGFREAGVDCDVIRVEPHLNVAELARAAATQPGTVVVSAGGDGTVNAVAAGVAGTGGCMGVLPVGTLNHFARDLGIPLKLELAMDVIRQQNCSAVDMGEVNGHLFVNNSSVGIYAEVVTERERLQRSGLGKWLALVVASARALVRYHRIAVQLTVDGKAITRRTPILFVGNNEYRMEGTRIGKRDRLDRGALFVYLTPGLSRLGMLRIALAALLGRVKEVSNFEQFCVSELTVDLHRSVCRVTLDGEVCQIPGPLHYRIRPALLNVCTPGPQ